MKAKYLVNTLDDLRDTVNTIHQVVKSTTDQDDIMEIMKRIPVDLMPLDTRTNSFILIVEIPEDI